MSNESPVFIYLWKGLCDLVTELLDLNWVEHVVVATKLDSVLSRTWFMLQKCVGWSTLPPANQHTCRHRTNSMPTSEIKACGVSNKMQIRAVAATWLLNGLGRIKLCLPGSRGQEELETRESLWRISSHRVTCSSITGDRLEITFLKRRLAFCKPVSHSRLITLIKVP